MLISGHLSGEIPARGESGLEYDDHVQLVLAKTGRFNGLQALGLRVTKQTSTRAGKLSVASPTICVIAIRATPKPTRSQGVEERHLGEEPEIDEECLKCTFIVLEPQEDGTLMPASAVRSAEGVWLCSTGTCHYSK